jgi:hypothetical protein
MTPVVGVQDTPPSLDFIKLTSSAVYRSFPVMLIVMSLTFLNPIGEFMDVHVCPLANINPRSRHEIKATILFILPPYIF